MTIVYTNTLYKIYAMFLWYTNCIDWIASARTVPGGVGDQKDVNGPRQAQSHYKVTASFCLALTSYLYGNNIKEM